MRALASVLAAAALAYPSPAVAGLLWGTNFEKSGCPAENLTITAGGGTVDCDDSSRPVSGSENIRTSMGGGLNLEVNTSAYTASATGLEVHRFCHAYDNAHESVGWFNWYHIRGEAGGNAPKLQTSQLNNFRLSGGGTCVTNSAFSVSGGVGVNHEVVVVWNHTTDVAELYVDGVLSSKATGCTAAPSTLVEAVQQGGIGTPHGYTWDHWMISDSLDVMRGDCETPRARFGRGQPLHWSLPPPRNVFTEDFASGTDADLDGHANWSRVRTGTAGATLTHQATTDDVAQTGPSAEVNPYLYTAGTTNGLDQFVLLEGKGIDQSGGANLAGGVVRYTDSSSKFDVIVIRDGGELDWRVFSPDESGDILASSCNTGGLTNGQYAGITKEGTGDATQIKGWVLGGTPDPNPATWGTCLCGYYITGQTATTCSVGNVAVSDPGTCGDADDETCLVDSGNTVGIVCRAQNDTVVCDNWSGGDL